MSVLECNRNGCYNIMCDYYSDIYGYLCQECLQELVDTGGEISIEDFLDTNKNQDSDVKACWEELIKTTFKNRYEDE